MKDLGHGHPDLGRVRKFSPSLSSAALGFATGSTLLLLAALFTYPYAFPSSASALILWVALTVAAVWSHGLAWLVLLITVIRPSSEPKPERPATKRTRTALYVSVITCLVAIGSVPAQLNGISPTIFPLLGPFSFLFAPYLPLVFGPVVLSHSYVFLRQDDGVSVVQTRNLKTFGGLSLATVAIIAMAGQVAFYVSASGLANWAFWLFIPLPAGLTGIGYWVLYLALRMSHLDWLKVAR